MAQAQADLYKERGVNPGAGCLPYILQIVVLIAFFNVFSTTLANGANPTEKFNNVLYEPLKFKPGEELNKKFLYLDITKPDVFKISDKISLPGLLLIASAIAQFLSVKVMAPQTKLEEKIAGKTVSKEDDMQLAMQKSMTYTFPFITLVVGMNFASGLALYWFIFSLAQYYQQISSQKKTT